MKWLKLLHPGMNVKRWLFLHSFGVLLIGVGIALILERLSRMLRGKISYHFSPHFINHSLIILGGLILVGLGIRGLLKTILTAYLPHRNGDLIEKLFKSRQLKRGPKLVAIGGGTGLSALLHGVKNYTSNITAIVTVADDGGSSGILRQRFGMLPPGDIRNCLLALADSEPLMAQLFQYRFGKGSEFNGHSFGNLFITAMSKVTGDFQKAVKESSKVLAIRGQVLPVTLDNVILSARMADGTVVDGESEIPKRRGKVKEVFLKPQESKANPEVLEALREADAIILGPGSLYTSIIPNLLVPEVVEAIAASPALKIYICNVMTQPGETDAYTVADHLKALLDHTHRRIVDYVVVNTEEVPPHLLQKYAEEGAHPVILDEERVRALGPRLVKGELISKTNYVRHDPNKLANLLMKLMAKTLFSRR